MKRKKKTRTTNRATKKTLKLPHQTRWGAGHGHAKINICIDETQDKFTLRTREI